MPPAHLPGIGHFKTRFFNANLNMKYSSSYIYGDIKTREEAATFGSDIASPVLICGCHGGGTSFTAKMLRHSGLFVGADAGSPESRKYHESKAFLNANRRILEQYGDESGRALGSVVACLEDLATYNGRYKFVWMSDIETIMAQYALPNVSLVKWGWKDPRNSLTFPIWKMIFPEARAVIVAKAVDSRPSRSSQGRWFRGAPEWIRELYMHPVWLSEFHSSCLCVEFEKLTTDWRTFAAVANFCGLKAPGADEYRRLLERVGFEFNITPSEAFYNLRL